MAGQQLIDRCLAVALVAVFGYAGITKIVDPAAFLVAIENFRLVPRGIAWATALLLPPLEMAAAGALLWTSWRRTGATVLTALLAVFEVALLTALLRGIDLDCGCFGSGNVGSPLWPFLRNLLLLSACLWLLRPTRQAA